jgi:hypothetical protein
MRHLQSFIFVLFLAPFAIAAEPCREIHGRAIEYSGDGFLAIWHIGTHHTFFVTDEKSTILIEKFIPYEGSDREKALFADFTICPTESFKPGASQLTLVTRIRHAHVVIK